LELNGKTIGIIGYGHMGKAFASKLKGFDVQVICHDLLPHMGDANAQQVSLSELQAQADVLSIHTDDNPLSKKNGLYRIYKYVSQTFLSLQHGSR
jgi:D-3-phosphoglycerate dehydrogenase